MFCIRFEIYLFKVYNLFMVGYKAALTGTDPESLSGMDILVDFNF